MLLDDAKSKGVVYVNKATYDQALMLSSRFDGNPQRVIDVLKSKKTEAYIATPGLPQLITEMSQSMPQPLNMLAPFLMLCTQNQGMTWDKENREMAYGILHQYSQLIDFNAMTLVPAEVRANVTFPTTLLLQYEASWDDLCSTLKEKVVLVQQTAPVNVQPVQTVPAPAPVQQAPAPVQQTPAQPVAPTPAPAPAPAPAEDDGLTEVERRILALRQRKEKEHEEMVKKEQAQKQEQEKPKPAPAPASQPKPAGGNDAAAANAVLDEYDFD